MRSRRQIRRDTPDWDSVAVLRRCGLVVCGCAGVYGEDRGRPAVPRPRARHLSTRTISSSGRAGDQKPPVNLKTLPNNIHHHPLGEEVVEKWVNETINCSLRSKRRARQTLNPRARESEREPNYVGPGRGRGSSSVIITIQICHHHRSSHHHSRCAAGTLPENDDNRVSRPASTFKLSFGKQ